jgi:hypothetical protein
MKSSRPIPGLQQNPNPFDAVSASLAVPQASDEPPPFDLTIPNPFRKYRFRPIDHSSPEFSRTAAIWRNVVDHHRRDMARRQSRRRPAHPSRDNQNARSRGLNERSATTAIRKVRGARTLPEDANDYLHHRRTHRAWLRGLRPNPLPRRLHASRTLATSGRIRG